MVAVIGDNFINQPGCSLAADKGWGWSETSLQSPPTHRQLFGLRTNLHQIVSYQLKWKKPTLSFLCPTVSHLFSTIWRQIIIKQQCCCVSPSPTEWLCASFGRFPSGADRDQDRSIFHYLSSICPSVKAGNWLLGYWPYIHLFCATRVT